MADMIEGNKMFSVQLEPWHKKGIILDSPPTSEEAIKAAGMDWGVEKRDLFFKRKDTDYTMHKLSSRQAILRTSDSQVLGFASPSYEVVQNSDAFRFFDPIIREGLATYETAGVLTNGKVWILARMAGDMVIGKDDEIRKYLLLVNSHDGTSSVMVQPTPIRVVCNNTLQLSLQEGLIIKHAHRAGVQGRLEMDRNEILGTLQGFDSLGEVFQQMHDTQLTSSDIDQYLTDLVDPGQEIMGIHDDLDEDQRIPRAVQNRIAAKEKILFLHDSGRGSSKNTQGTLWGIYNAAVEFADYHLGARAKDRATYQLFGEGGRFKQRALSLAAGR